MKGRISSNRELSAIVLSILLLLPPIANARIVGEAVQQPKVFATSFADTVEVEGVKVGLAGFARLTEYVNGTNLVEVSVTVENVCSVVQKIRINFTQTFTNEELTLMREGSVKKNPAVQPLSGPYDQYSFVKERWDDIIFVVSSPQIWIKYHHDDNYQTYYPGMFNTPWELPPHVTYEGVKYNNEKVHTHLAVSDVYDWKSGAKSREEVMAKYLILGSSATGSFLGSLLGWALVRWLALTGGWAAVVAAFAAALGAIIGWLIQLLFGGNEAAFVENVVEAEQGDGFCWKWGFHTKDYDAFCYEPWIGWLSCIQNWYYAQECSQLLSQYHRMELLCYDVKEFRMTWGAQRDSSPQTYTTELWYNIVVPAGIFADYGSIFK